MQRTKYVGSFLKNHAAIASGKVVAYVRRGRESNSLNRRLMVREARRFTSGRRKQTKEKKRLFVKRKRRFSYLRSQTTPEHACTLVLMWNDAVN